MLEKVSTAFNTHMIIKPTIRTQPCWTMKAIVELEKKEDHGKNCTCIRIRVEFPGDYTEIKHERVLKLFERLFTAMNVLIS